MRLTFGTLFLFALPLLIVSDAAVSQAEPRAAMGSLKTPGVIVALSSGPQSNELIAGREIEYLKGNNAIISSRLGSSNIAGGETSDESLDELCQNLTEQGVADSCEPDREVSISLTPNDPNYSSEWHLAQIDAASGWDITNNSSSVVVAVIDTGIDLNHPDLASNIWTNTGEIPGNQIDDDHNGYIDDVHGANFITNSGDPMDNHTHGTHVAGIISAATNNAKGVSGINWNAKILPLKFLGADGSGYISGAIKALNYLIDLKERGVNIVVANNSWGGPGFSQALANAVAEASAAGILVVAAAGNSASNNDLLPNYPANLNQSVPSVVSVAASDSNDNLAFFSNYGAATVDVAAPGVQILSTFLGGGYAQLSGTSMATPVVSGIAALLASHEPTLTPLQLKQRILNTSLNLSSLNGVIKYGRVSAYRTLANITTPFTPNQNQPQPPELIEITKVKGTLAPGESVRLTVKGAPGSIGYLTLKVKQYTCDITTFVMLDDRTHIRFSWPKKGRYSRGKVRLGLDIGDTEHDAIKVKLAAPSYSIGSKGSKKPPLSVNKVSAEYFYSSLCPRLQSHASQIF